MKRGRGHTLSSVTRRAAWYRNKRKVDEPISDLGTIRKYLHEREIHRVKRRHPAVPIGANATDLDPRRLKFTPFFIEFVLCFHVVRRAFGASPIFACPLSLCQCLVKIQNYGYSNFAYANLPGGGSAGTPTPRFYVSRRFRNGDLHARVVSFLHRLKPPRRSDHGVLHSVQASLPV